MLEIPRYRVAAYVGMAAVLLLVGWNSLRPDDGAGRDVLAGASAVTSGEDPGGGGASGMADSEVAGLGHGSPLQVGSGGRRIVVDVSGAVRKPGVYGFEYGQRVIDAIRRAGGVTLDAYPSAINRAALLADGQQVVVPARMPGGVAGGPGGAGSVAGAPGAAVADAPISFGTATQAQLEEIEGIGPVTAQSILEFRDSQGGISSIEELDQVSGIGPVTMEALRSRLQP